MRVRKIRRRRRLFRRRQRGQVFVKVLLWLLIIPAVIGGYFLAQHLATIPPKQPASSSATTGGTTTTAPQTTPTTTPTPPSADTATFAGMRGFWLPTKALFDFADWAPTLEAAKAAGYNTVLFDLKDIDGRIWYRSATELAAQARAVRDNALTPEELAAAAKTLKDKYGLTAVPRLYAFRDNQAPRYLPTARVAVQGSPDSVWYDNDPAAGGRRWLNPYSADARRYITSLAAELKEIGFSLVMLDGVQFPTQESSAHYGTKEETALPRGDVFAGFASEISAAVGKNGWMLSMTALSSVGEKTTAYGANPVTFGAAAVSPWLAIDDLPNRLTLGDQKVSSARSHPYEASLLLFGQLQTRLKLMDAAPVPVPWIVAEDAAEVTHALYEVFGENAPMILYDEDGRYTFD